jgi:hypothetical protein
VQKVPKVQSKFLKPGSMPEQELSGLTAAKILIIFEIYNKKCKKS